jgi:hypothetical protein
LGCTSYPLYQELLKTGFESILSKYNLSEESATNFTLVDNLGLVLMRPNEVLFSILFAIQYIYPIDLDHRYTPPVHI